MLSDEKIKELAEKMPRGFLWSEGCEWESGVLIQEATEFARAIEAAILAEQGKLAEQITSENFAERISDKFSELIERLGNFPAEAKKLDPRMWDVINIYNPRNQQQPAAEVLAEQAKEPPACEVHPYHLRAAEDGGHWCRETLLYSGNNPGDLDHGRVPRVKLYLHPAPIVANASLPEGMVLPKKLKGSPGARLGDMGYVEGWNACIDTIAAAEKEYG